MHEMRRRRKQVGEKYVHCTLHCACVVQLGKKEKKKNIYFCKVLGNGESSRGYSQYEPLYVCSAVMTTIDVDD